MGAISCCSYNAAYLSKKYEESLENKPPPITQQTTYNESKSTNIINKSFSKKSTIFFDKSDFINMKTKSLFEDYDVKEKLGEGAYGCVYKAFHKKSKMIRAVKAIKRKHVDEKAFNMEIAILKNVDHPNIIRIFECFYDSNYY